MSTISSIRETWRSIKPHAQKATRWVIKKVLPEDQFCRYEAQVAKGWWSRKRAHLNLVWVSLKKLFTNLKDFLIKK